MKPLAVRRCLARGMLAGSLLIAGASGASPAQVDKQVRSTMQLRANIQHGNQLYARLCLSCHGPAALGDAVNVVPSLASQNRAYLVKQLADFAALERSADAHEGILRPAGSRTQAWADIAAYLAALPPMRFPESGDGSAVEAGEDAFKRQCAACHGDDARGDADAFVPSLRNQHYSYLVRQVRSIAAWHRLDVDSDLVRLFNGMETEDLVAIADYLSRLRDVD
ncbi:MAG: c-type cytochrome [Steroidobacteraceae bacterium]